MTKAEASATVVAVVVVVVVAWTTTETLHSIINENDDWFHFTASFSFQIKQTQFDELVNVFHTLKLF